VGIEISDDSEAVEVDRYARLRRFEGAITARRTVSTNIKAHLIFRMRSPPLLSAGGLETHLSFAAV